MSDDDREGVAHMMWIVRIALSRPYTFVVMSLLIAAIGGLAIATMPVDIFPKIDIPVVSSIWSYGGLSPTEMQYLRVAQVQFRLGLVDYLTVIDAERTLLPSELALAQNVNLQLGAGLRLIKALGGGWQSRS
jgi:hypothetical protein